jgi:hypothetical protein
VAVPIILSVRRYAMLDILLRDGDLVAGKYGDISLCEDENEDVVQTANNNILLRYGNNKFHKELGNKVYNLRKKSNQSGIEMIQAECINAIHSDNRIREIKRVDVTLLGKASCSVDYTLVYAKTTDRQTNTNENNMMDTYDEPDEILVEVSGRSYINAFNIGGGI